ncbi:MAG: hypothetical protein ACLSVD_14275 [Eggerthellaceae bacterium]
MYTEVGVGCTGEGLRMGLDIGAATWATAARMASRLPGSRASQTDRNKALWINSRASASPTRPARPTTSTTTWRADDQKFFAVYDQAMVDALDRPALEVQFGLGRACSPRAPVAEAAAALGIDGAQRRRRSRYNELAARAGRSSRRRRGARPAHGGS